MENKNLCESVNVKQKEGRQYHYFHTYICTGSLHYLTSNWSIQVVFGRLPGVYTISMTFLRGWMHVFKEEIDFQDKKTHFGKNSRDSFQLFPKMFLWECVCVGGGGWGTRRVVTFLSFFLCLHFSCNHAMHFFCIWTSLAVVKSGKYLTYKYALNI